MRADLAKVTAPIAAATPMGPDDVYLGFDVFAEWNVSALVTSRAAGSFSTLGDAPVGEVMARWDALQRFAAAGEEGRFATARQVHGANILHHADGWRGWLRGPAADGHFAPTRGTTLAVTVADCVPVFVVHPSGAVALLHSGWRGTVAGIVPAAIRQLVALGYVARDLRVLTGPAICGTCYEVSPEVYGQLTGRAVDGPITVALDAVIARQAREAGVREIHATDRCTRCDSDLFYSHRAGDPGRQLGVVWAS